MSQIKKVVFGLLTLTACLYGSGTTAQTDGDGPFYVALRAEQMCDQMKSDHEFQSWAEVSDCYEQNVRIVYTAAEYPNPDLIDLLYVKYREIHANMDAGKISVSEGAKQKKKTLEEINRIIDDRTVIRFEA